MGWSPPPLSKLPPTGCLVSPLPAQPSPPLRTNYRSAHTRTHTYAQTHRPGGHGQRSLPTNGCIHPRAPSVLLGPRVHSQQRALPRAPLRPAPLPTSVPGPSPPPGSALRPGPHTPTTLLPHPMTGEPTQQRPAGSWGADQRGHGWRLGVGPGWAQPPRPAGTPTAGTPTVEQGLSDQGSQVHREPRRREAGPPEQPGTPHPESRSRSTPRPGITEPPEEGAVLCRCQAGAPRPTRQVEPPPGLRRGPSAGTAEARAAPTVGRPVQLPVALRTWGAGLWLTAPRGHPQRRPPAREPQYQALWESGSRPRARGGGACPPRGAGRRVARSCRDQPRALH